MPGDEATVLGSELRHAIDELQEARIEGVEKVLVHGDDVHAVSEHHVQQAGMQQELLIYFEAKRCGNDEGLLLITIIDTLLIVTSKQFQVF